MYLFRCITKNNENWRSIFKGSELSNGYRLPVDSAEALAVQKSASFVTIAWSEDRLKANMWDPSLKRMITLPMVSSNLCTKTLSSLSIDGAIWYCIVWQKSKLQRRKVQRQSEKAQIGQRWCPRLCWAGKIVLQISTTRCVFGLLGSSSWCV